MKKIDHKSPISPLGRLTLFSSAAVIALGLPSCNYSDDPREGGLFGYMQHGEAGYQRRLDRRAQELEGIERDTERMRAGTSSLEKQRNAEKARMTSLRGDLSRIDSQLASIEAQLARGNVSDPGLSQQIAAQRRKAEALKYDDARTITQLAAERDKLEREVANLRKRAALALEL